MSIHYHRSGSHHEKRSLHGDESYVMDAYQSHAHIFRTHYASRALFWPEMSASTCTRKVENSSLQSAMNMIGPIKWIFRKMPTRSAVSLQRWSADHSLVIPLQVHNIRLRSSKDGRATARIAITLSNFLHLPERNIFIFKRCCTRKGFFISLGVWTLRWGVRLEGRPSTSPYILR